MNRVAIVATHHKTGTVWMRNVFRGIAGALKVPFKYLKETSIPTDIGPPAICFSPHSAISPGDIQQYRAECRILHMIRDPRDVIVSAAHYHQTSDELWLHKKRRAFDGMTYQEKINSLADDRERYLFELRNSGNRTVKAMQRWNYSLPNAVECRYEDMIEDSEMTLFTRVAEHLGFEGDELEVCRQQFWKNSLFGDMRNGPSHHVRSGKSSQWIRAFDQKIGREFVAEFGNVLVELGYEPDNSWLEALPETR